MTIINISKPHKLDDGGNPTPAAMREIADAIGRLHENGARLAMTAGSWNAENPCGTFCCHAGAFALAAGVKCEWVAGMKRTVIERAADLLSNHIGFPRDVEYMIWALQNPHIWGNGNGGKMFCHELAFSAAGDDPESGANVTLATIASHYRQVAERLEALGG